MFKVQTAETVIVRKPWCLVSIMLTISATDRELTAPVSAVAEVAGRTAAWKLTCLYLPPRGRLLLADAGIIYKQTGERGMIVSRRGIFFSKSRVMQTED